MSEEIDVSKFGLLFAGAQKNLGPAGVTLVIVREDLIGDAMDITPTMLDYKTHADNGSMYNTPPTYGIYVLKLVLEWIKEQGGVKALQEINEKKAKIPYDYLDSSKMFKGTVVPEDRSLMNAPFVTGNEELDAKFVAEAKSCRFCKPKGSQNSRRYESKHLQCYACRGSKKLVEFMKKFESENM